MLNLLSITSEDPPQPMYYQFIAEFIAQLYKLKISKPFTVYFATKIVFKSKIVKTLALLLIKLFNQCLSIVKRAVLMKFEIRTVYCSYILTVLETS